MTRRTEHPVSVRRASQRIWVAIRNQVRGSQMNCDAYEQLIADEIAKVAEPFRVRSEQAGRDRRKAVANLLAACEIIGRMRKLLRSVGTTKHAPTRELLDQCARLAAEDFSKLKMPLEEPDEKPADVAEKVSEEIEGDDFALAGGEA